RCIVGGRVDEEVAHPHPSQTRMCRDIKARTEKIAKDSQPCRAVDRAFNTSSLNRSRALAPGSPRLSATVAWIACASTTSLAFARVSALATLAASACARSVSVLFGVPRCLPPRLSPYCGAVPVGGRASGKQPDCATKREALSVCYRGAARSGVRLLAGRTMPRFEQPEWRDLS